ncbi:MAG: hypothetical protein WAV05_16885 [Anaerolineales bacterium]
MKNRRVILILSVILLGISASFIVINTLVQANPLSSKLSEASVLSEELQRSAPADLLPLRFPQGDWPWYAQGEIFLNPEPLMPGSPVEICAGIVNDDINNAHVGFLQFGFAPLGIGVPYQPIGTAEILVPAGSYATGCTMWMSPESGRWGIEVLLFQEGAQDPLRSLRNIDLWEPLLPGEPRDLIFQIGPMDAEGTLTFTLTNLLPEWQVDLVPRVIIVNPYQVYTATLSITPPLGIMLGSNLPIVDVEGFLNDQSIGGFRRVDSPAVPLHVPIDPPYAEREISVDPYPPLAGEPTEIFVELRNPTDHPQDVVVSFSWANFGIGLPFTPIDGGRPVHLPPYSVVKECIHWVPPISGHLCLQITLEAEGYEPQFSQRNIDVNEPLQPGIPDPLTFPVGNPFGEPVTITLGLIPHLPEWGLELSQDVLPAMQPGEIREVTLTVTPPAEQPLPPDNTPIADVEAYADSRLMGGFRKIFRPPIPIHIPGDPIYAEREITIDPYPPRIGEPTEICVELRNPTPYPQDVMVHFSWANFGIGLPFTPIDGGRPVHLPPYSVVKQCIHWVPPISGHLCLQVTLEAEGYEPQFSQRNIDVNEPLQPGIPDPLTFPVGNPSGEPVTITLGLVPHLPEWGFELSQDVLPAVQPGEIREVTLTVTPPAEQPLPPDNTPIVDVEAYTDGRLMGGFRKIFRPLIPIHIPGDPIYAEREIFINPYPPRAGEPTEICVELRNPTDHPQDVVVHFSWANFGIGLPFTPIDGGRPVHLPPYSVVRECIHWVPPFGGLFCTKVEVNLPGYELPFASQRNIDVGEPLEPFVPHAQTFLVGNPLEEPVTITLGLIPHMPDWGLELSQDVLQNIQPGEVREVTLTVTPPEILPPDGTPIVDVEAFANGNLIGGISKIFRPPVPIHIPKDPVYAESEIGVDPYPLIPGMPTKLSVEVFNPTDEDHIITAIFSIAPFGIGLPFNPSHITPNPVQIYVPAKGAARAYVVWTPPDWQGKFCVRVTLEMEGHEPIWSQRNIDVGEPLEPGVPHDMTFPVGSGDYTEPVTITLGLIPHRYGWQVSLSEDVLVNVQPGEIREVTLTVTPPFDVKLGSGEPIVDVEAFVEGELLGGFRKLDMPPVPIHKPHEKGYSESEIFIDPYPPMEGETTIVGALVHNTSDMEATVELEFGWADFGVGIPFTTTGMLPYTHTITLGPGMSDTPSVEWTPIQSGHQCVIVHLTDPQGIYEPQESQRNVDVIDNPACGVTQVFTFTVMNNSPVAVTLDIGMITFNVPPDWVVTTVPSGSVEIGPFDEQVIEVHVTIPCPKSLQDMLTSQKIKALQAESGGMSIIDVEGYIEGELIGGIELQFRTELVYATFLPFSRK